MGNKRIGTWKKKKKVGIEVGGYKGEGITQFAYAGVDIVHCFEPIKEFYDECVSVAVELEGQLDIKLINKALWIEEGKKECILDDDGSSFFIDGDKKETINTTTLLKYMEENEIDHINYIRFNCEGAEYALIRYILDNNLDEKIDTIIIQYHPELKDKIPHYEDINLQLGEFEKRGFKREPYVPRIVAFKRKKDTLGRTTDDFECLHRNFVVDAETDQNVVGIEQPRAWWVVYRE